jgi:hypothetical protein
MNGIYSDTLTEAVPRQPVTATNFRCSFCGQPLYRRPWDGKKDLLQCFNCECPRDHQKQKMVSRR